MNFIGQADATTNCVGHLLAWAGLYPPTDTPPSPPAVSPLTVTLIDPPDDGRRGTYTNDTNFTYYVEANNTIDHCEIYTNETGAWAYHHNETSVTNGTNNYIFPTINTVDIEGDILWNIKCCTENVCNSSASNFTFEIDLTSPNITIDYPTEHIWSMNKTHFKLNYTAYDQVSDLYRGNFSLYYNNGTFIKNLLYYDDLNVSSINESLWFSWENLSYTDMVAEVCFSDELANSPKKPGYSVKKGGLFGYKKEELIFQDTETDVDVTVTLEIITRTNGLTKYSVDRGELEVIAYKTDDDRHIIYGGRYNKKGLPPGQEKEVRFRYVYHSNNDIELNIRDPAIGLIHADVGMQPVLWQHKDLLAKGWSISVYMEGEDVVVEFWKDDYDEVIDFDPISGGVNYACVNSSIMTKSYTLTLHAVDYENETYLNNFTVTITGGYNETQNSSYGNVTFPATTGEYSFNVSAPGYVSIMETFNITGDLEYNFSMFKNNSVYITIRDEETGALIGENVTVIISSVYGEIRDYTTSGSYTVSGLIPTDYTFRLSSVSYDERSYNVSVSAESYQFLNVFLAAGTDTVIFTALDSVTSDYIEEASVTMYRTINSTWQAVESRSTDITGRAQLTYIPSTKYRFTFTKANYEAKTFYLDPVLFEEYDVLMDEIISINGSPDFGRVSVSYSPKAFTFNELTDLEFIFGSPWAELTLYGYNLTYPGGTYNTSGSNAIGGILNNSFTITATTSDTVTILYYYDTPLSGYREFKAVYHVNPQHNFTFISNKDDNFGMGDFERILVTTVLVLIIVGFSTMVGVPIVGLALGLFAFGYFTYVGFVPLWSILISLFVGIVVLISRSD